MLYVKEQYGMFHEKGYEYYSDILLFFDHYIRNVLLFKLNIFVEKKKCGKNLSHQHQVISKI